MEFKKINISNLKAADYNPRKDLQPQDSEYQKIKLSINEFGYVDPVIVNSDMTIIGGHQRVKVLKDLGFDSINCVVVDVDKTKEKALNIALNKISGEWDTGKLESLIKELNDIDDFNVELTGFDFEEIENLLKSNDAEVADDEFDVGEALEQIEEPVSKHGDVWLLGRHRLICGDSTNEQDVEKLMNGNKAKLIVTDPPYNVNYEGRTDEALKIQNDNMEDKEFYNFLLKAFENMFEIAHEGCSIYVFHADTEGINFRTAFKNAGFKLAQCLVWIKDNFVLGRQDYHWRHEPVLYGWKEGKAHYFVDDRTQDTILEFPKPKRNSEHPTMKPIELIVKIINNSSRHKDIVVDMFGGSGSTLIACEQTDRICYSCELDPKYVDVIIKRFETLTGQKAIKE